MSSSISSCGNAAATAAMDGGGFRSSDLPRPAGISRRVPAVRWLAAAPGTSDNDRQLVQYSCCQLPEETADQGYKESNSVCDSRIVGRDGAGRIQASVAADCRACRPTQQRRLALLLARRAGRGNCLKRRRLTPCPPGWISVEVAAAESTQKPCAPSSLFCS